MVTDTTWAVDAGGVGAGGVATGEGVVGDEPQAIDTPRITTPTESLFTIIFNSRDGLMARPVATSADRWPLSASPLVDRCDFRRCSSLRQGPPGLRFGSVPTGPSALVS
jgi:hypothetical protein